MTLSRTGTGVEDRGGRAADTGGDRPRISVAVMHHPFRGRSLTDLVESCRPLDARVVMDPDPTGPPSPLRTAKLAWASVDPGATHHLVLQDDVTLCPGFAEQLTAAVAQRPDHALALYTNWNSPHNSYLVRCAAVAGQSWAPLGHHEWVPTLGLVLPAGAARELAAHLGRFPDDFRDDDELVVGFCAQKGYPVTASVPHLLEHGGGPSLAGNDAHGPRHATVPVGTATPPVEHWQRPGPRVFPPRSGTVGRPYAVELQDSRCAVRLLRPGAREPLEHPFGWDWTDWAGWTGADPARVRADLHSLEERRDQDAVTSLSRPARTELGAAAWLLGHDVSRTAWDRPPGPVRLRDRDEALRSWIRSGLAPLDAAELGPGELEGTVEWARRALELGRRAGNEAGRPGRSADGSTALSPAAGPDAGVREAVSEMAVREAAILSGAAPRPPATWALVHPCPWCGAAPGANLPELAARHSGGGALSYLAASDAPDPTALPGADSGAVLELLSCERPTVRGLLALAHGVRAHGPTWFRTRSTALLGLLSTPGADPSAPVADDPARWVALLPRLARAEADWWDSPGTDRRPGKGILPVSFTSAAGVRSGAPSRFLTAHAASPALDALAQEYRRIRFDAVRGRL
ncbi:hypothetical protein [Streptomyces uncialis]|uniref:hypothetical protein n=1 Tax=Streptomyces uncialis TaxID=1048205 RepID=UPI00386B1A2D|nr:hypothetical protein OG924_01980 [Streptomyces uncialis]